MKFTEKFRELIIDPCTIQFSNWEYSSILEYYHAGNDVLHCLGKDNKHYILKLSRHKDSNFRNHITISEMLKSLGWTNIQGYTEYGTTNGIEYLVLPFYNGFRLSQEEMIYRKDEKLYCEKFGINIGEIHKLAINTTEVKPRKFHNLNETKDELINLETINSYLTDNKPYNTTKCFIHGDHHNANLLWNGLEISCILDWELAGIGNREFDLAWSTLPRPGQSIFQSRIEEDNILNGYSQINTFNYDNYKYYRILLISHFTAFSKNNMKYLEWAKKELKYLSNIDLLN